MTKPGFKIPSSNNARNPLREIDDLYSVVENRRQEVDARILGVEELISKPGVRGGFEVDDVRSYGTIQNAVNAVPSSSSKTVFVTNSQTVAANLTISSNISLVVLKGGGFVISAGVTLTINGSFDPVGNTLADIFSGSGSYVFGKTTHLIGAGTPESVVTAPVGSTFQRNNGGAATTFYIKESGTGNTGWVANGSVAGSGTLNYIPLWTPDGNTLGNSIASQSGTTITVAGSLTVSTNLTVTSGISVLDVARIGEGAWGLTNEYAFFGHNSLSHATSANAALWQHSNGATAVNASSGQSLFLKIADAIKVEVTGSLVAITPNTAVSGNVNVGGATNTSGYGLNVAGSRIANSGGFPLYSFGVGTPADTAAGNTEYMYLHHNGTLGILEVSKTLSGSYRALELRSNNTAQITLGAAGGATVHNAATLQSTLDVSGLTTMTGAGIGSTPTDRLLITNTTAAAAGAQQYSPALHFSGRGWKTDATAASQAVDFRSYLIPIQGTANPTGALVVERSINGGAYAEIARFGSGLNLQLPGTNPLYFGGTSAADFKAAIEYNSGDGGYLSFSGSGITFYQFSTNLIGAGDGTFTGVTRADGGLTIGSSSTIDKYEESTFTVTLTGVTAAVTGTARYTRIGKIVTLYIPTLNGTSNTTSCTITGLPANITPVRDQWIATLEVRDNGGWYQGLVSPTTANTLVLWFRTGASGTMGSGGSFTASGTKGIESTTITYTLQ